MAAVAAEADGEPVFGQVVGVGQEPSPLMDARVLRRLCGMLDVPAAGSLADQARERQPHSIVTQNHFQTVCPASKSVLLVA